MTYTIDLQLLAALLEAHGANIRIVVARDPEQLDALGLGDLDVTSLLDGSVAEHMTGGPITALELAAHVDALLGLVEPAPDVAALKARLLDDADEALARLSAALARSVGHEHADTIDQACCAATAGLARTIVEACSAA